MFNVDFYTKRHRPFYIGFGLGPVRYQTSNSDITVIPNPSSQIFTRDNSSLESSLGVAPRIGFRGSFDFNTSIIYAANRSSAVLLFGLSYVVGSKKKQKDQ